MFKLSLPIPMETVCDNFRIWRTGLYSFDNLPEDIVVLSCGRTILLQSLVRSEALNHHTNHTLTSILDLSVHAPSSTLLVLDSHFLYSNLEHTHR